MYLSSNSLTTSVDQNIEGHTVSHMLEEGGHYVKTNKALHSAVCSLC